MLWVHVKSTKIKCSYEELRQALDIVLPGAMIKRENLTQPSEKNLSLVRVAPCKMGGKSVHGTDTT